MKHIFMRKGPCTFIFFILIGVTTMPLTNATLQGNDEQGCTSEQLSYTFSFTPPIMGTMQVAGGTFTKITMPGCLEIGTQPGDPTVPIRFIQLLLPPQSAVDAVSVTGSPQELRSTVREPVFPAQDEVPIGSAAPSGLIMNDEVYSSHKIYPAIPYSGYQVGYSHGYTIFSMALEPVQLIPAEGRLLYYPTMTVTISVHKTGYASPFYRGTSEDEAWVQTLVNNPEVVAQYAGLSRSEYPGGLCDPSDHYDYVIVTTTANGLDHWATGGTITYNWTSLMQFHTAEGLSCTEVLVQDINACPDYWNTSYYPLFNDTQAHIREFCKDAYQDWGASYILVAGDSDTIPARQLYYEYEGNVDSDLYWSNLDNSFNADHDNQWGEEGDSGFDPYSELFIGRVTCDVPQDVSNWLTKSFYYATSADPEYLDNTGFFAGNNGWPPGGDGTDTLIDFAAINGTDDWYGSDPGQWPSFLGFLYGFETWNLIHPDDMFNLSVRWTAGYPPNPGWHYAQNAAVPFRNAINNDSVTLITGLGHADYTMSLDVYDSDWKTLYHNTKPFFIIDLGCHCGDFDAGNDGVLDTMLFSSDTSLAFGCLYNTGYGWSSFDSTNSSDALQTKLFWDYFFDLTNNSQSTTNWQLGKGVAWSKDIMAPTLNWTWSAAPGCWRGTIEDRLLFADPALKLRAPQEVEVNHPPSITTMSWDPNIGLTLNAMDPEGDDVFYMIDWGDGTTTQWLGPYQSGTEIVFNHTWSQPGDYTVRARAKDVWNAASDWTDPLLIHIPYYELTITIRGGLGITVKITNTGEEDVNLISCHITLTGHSLMGLSYGNWPAVLPVGKSAMDKEFLLGFGRVTIGVNVTYVEGADVQKSAQGFLLGIFVLGLK
jgi:hypothetical protein